MRPGKLNRAITLATVVALGCISGAADAFARGAGGAAGGHAAGVGMAGGRGATTTGHAISTPPGKTVGSASHARVDGSVTTRLGKGLVTD
jgi:hypothetical protein